MASILPATQKTLHLESFESGIRVKTLPVPEPIYGSAIVKILAADIISYHREIYNGQQGYTFPKPLIPGSSAIGRVVAVGADATELNPGQLVYVDCVIRSRDQPADVFLTAIRDGSSDGSKRLMRDVWRDGAFAEYQRVLLENCMKLNEERLCGQFGHSFAELAYIATMIVPYGGLRDMHVEPGHTVLICPATGNFGAAGVLVAVAMGARVIAMARDESKLKLLKNEIENSMPNNAGIETVKITGDEGDDATAVQQLGPLDAILDLTPFTATTSSHTRSAITALVDHGKVSLMGSADITSSPSIRWILVGRNITMKGQLMYSRTDVVQFIKMLETGVFSKAKKLADVKQFNLEDHKASLDEAATWTSIRKAVVFVP